MPQFTKVFGLRPQCVTTLRIIKFAGFSIFLSCFLTSANAASIIVNAQLGASGCDLAEAIESANTDSNIGSCTRTGGSSSDTILLSPIIQDYSLGLFLLNFSSVYGGTNLPDVTSDITIVGTLSQLQVISRPFGADNYRHFLVRHGGHLTLKNLALRGGELSQFNGGAIYIFCGGEVVLEDVELSGNRASGGGAIFLNGSCADTSPRLTAYRSAFHNNTARGNASNGGLGGAILQEVNNSVVIFDSTISNNQSLDSGGGLAIGGTPNTTLALINTTVTENTAATQGGGIWVFTGNSTAANSLTIRNSIISGNSAGEDGHEVWVRNTATLQSASLFNNVLGSSATTYSQATNLSEFLSDNILMTSNTADSKPLEQIIGPLQDNGGPTLSHELTPSSPALNTGVDFEIGGSFPIFLSFAGCRGTTAILGTETEYRPDQRGESRPVGEACDIGAIESKFGESDTCFVVPTADSKAVVFCL